ncbi:hypothetical protein ACSQ67_020693 [Phaseolus vulgaris]
MPDRKSYVQSQILTLRRSPRFLPQLNHTTPNPISATTSVKKSNDCTVELRTSPRFNHGDVGFSSLRRSPRFNNEGAGRGSKKGGNREIIGVKTKENYVVCDEGFGGNGGNGEKKKRNGDEIGKGAYLTAKPSPHFWKNVSKLVPGKSQQECFDRIHFDHVTPVQLQPRSRAKTLKSSPIQEFSLSASNLLNPIDIKVRRSNVLKPKNITTQKSVEKLLLRRLTDDLDRAGDIFSVLEPKIDLSTNALQSSESLSTTKQLKENKGFLQSCTETSSSSGNKLLSRFSGSHITDLVSPPVLKKVKNRVLHEKYVNKLRCRESRRRAASEKIIGEGRSIKRKDAVKAAKFALVSEARDAINKFRELQVNVMDNCCSSDEDNDDDIQLEDESE